MDTGLRTPLFKDFDLPFFFFNLHITDFDLIKSLTSSLVENEV